MSVQRAAERGAGFNSVKHRYYVASLILHTSIAEITAQLLSLSYVYLISSDDGAIIIFFLCRLTSWRESWLCTLVLMSCVSVTISYSFRCLTTETVKYTSFIENLAASKYSYVGTERETNVIINNKCTFCIFRGRAALCAKWLVHTLYCQKYWHPLL